MIFFIYNLFDFKTSLIINAKVLNLFIVFSSCFYMVNVFYYYKILFVVRFKRHITCQFTNYFLIFEFWVSFFLFDLMSFSFNFFEKIFTFCVVIIYITFCTLWLYILINYKYLFMIYSIFYRFILLSLVCCKKCDYIN